MSSDDALDDILTRYVQECIGLLDDEIKKTYQEAIEENKRLKQENAELRQKEFSQQKIDIQNLQQRLLADQLNTPQYALNALVRNQMQNTLINRKGW